MCTAPSSAAVRFASEWRSRSVSSSTSAASYSEPLEATFLDEDGREKPLLGGKRMASGPGRVLAAIVEQDHDETGILWSEEVVLYDVEVIALGGGSQVVLDSRSVFARIPPRGGADVPLDHGDARHEEKFADADSVLALLGVIVGKKTSLLRVCLCQGSCQRQGGVCRVFRAEIWVAAR